LVASILLGLVFLVSGGSKIAAGPSWPEQAKQLGAPPSVAAMLPVAEVALGAALVTRLIPVVAAAIALAVLVAFTTLIVRRLMQGRRPSCACFGAWSAKPIGAGHVLRNVGFIALAVAAMLS